MKIKNSVVMITGANRGIGRALVKASLDAGATRVYAGSRDPKQLDVIVAQAPDRVVPLSLDITDQRSLEAAAARAPDVSILINNAGVLASYNMLVSTAAQLQQDFATNLFGTLAATKAFLPALERAASIGGKGDASEAALVNLLSVVSLANMPALGGYSAAKAAAFSMTQALRGELVKKRIAVHAVLPGPVDTDMSRGIDMAKTSPDVVARAILDGVEQGLEDILPDPVAREMFAMWQRDPKALEHQFARM